MSSFRFECIVVGAGIQGSATAYQLAKRGRTTLLLDQSNPLLVPLVLDSLQKWIELEQSVGEQLFKKTGVLSLGDFGCIAEQSAILKQFGLNHQVLDHRQVNDRFPQFNYNDSWMGLFDPEGGVLFADRCLAAFQSEFQRFAGILKDDERVLDWKPGKTVEIITLKDGISTNYMADSIIFCLGSWMGYYFQDLALPLTPIEIRVCYWKTGIDPEKYSPDAFPCLIIKENGSELYAVPSVEHPGMIKLCNHDGPTVHPDNREYGQLSTSDPDIIIPKNHILKYLPKVNGSNPEIVESCLYTITPDYQFILDRHPNYDNVILGAGFSGTGFKFAPTIGTILADLALKEPTKFDLTPFSLDRNFIVRYSKL